MSELNPCEAIEILEDIYPSKKQIVTGEYPEVAEALDMAIAALRRAQHMPTVDTVEVVRCRDCVHFGECLVTENDYCSKGKRKEK